MSPEALDKAVIAAQQGDQQAFERVVRATHRELRIFLAVRTASAELVEEVVQATLVTAWERLPSYEPRRTFMAWLKGIGLRLLRRELTSKHRSSIHDLSGLLVATDIQQLADSEHDAAVRRLRRLHTCLDRLAAAERELVARRYQQGSSLQTIASALGRSETAIGSALHRIRQRLRRCIEAAPEEVSS